VCFFRGFARFFAYVPGLFPLSAVFFARFLPYRAGLLFAYLAGLLEPPVISFSPHQSLLRISLASSIVAARKAA
jgi:hypothetical protein